MKLILLRNNLLNGLTLASKTIGDNVNLPILKNVLVKADEKIVLSSTNLELAVRSTVPGKIIEPGEITVPFNVFNGIVTNLNSERITLEQKEKKLIVNTDNYEAIIQCQSAKEFPIIPMVKNKSASIKINADVFKEALAQVVVASQYSDIRPEISGVFMSYEEKALTLVATDSFRLSERKIVSEKILSSFEGASVIIPLKTVNELLRFFGGEENDLEVFVDPNQIFFKTETRQLTSRLIDGNFPAYQAIVPKQTSSEVFVNRQELISAIKLTSSFSGKANDVIIKTGENKKFLEILSSESSLGENRYVISAKISGEKFSAAFNWRYLLDGLKIYKGEEVVLGVNASDRPVTIKSSSDPFLIYVVMPIKG